MSDGEAFRPRRAWMPADDEVDLPDVDPTPVTPTGPARRGSADEAEELDAGSQPDAEPERHYALGDEPESTVAAPTPAPDAALLNPFARPGSHSAAAPIPSDTIIPAPVFPRSAGEFADSPSPAPRRSALSSTTPVESEQTAMTRSQADGDWMASHRRTLAAWAVAGVALAVIVGLIAFFVSRGTQPAEPTAPPPPSPSASASTSPSPTLAPLTVDSLLLPDDLAGIAPAATWAITDTTQAADEHTGRGACLSTEATDVNPTTSLQRVLGTSTDDQLAGLHQIDVYASADAAEEVFAARSEALASCAEVPSYIVGATDVAGLADQAFQVTIAFQNQPTQYHTVLMTLTGASIQLLDLARNDSPVEESALATALNRPQAELCEREEASCPGTVGVTPVPVPAVDPVGWLIPADLPRIRPGAGRWTAQEPTDVSVTQMGCENMTLATEPGPSSRQQATYLMTQDDQRPDTFGLDEVMFTFADPTAAAEFVTRLGNNLASCKDRVNTATVTEHPAVAAVGEDGLKLSSRLFTIKQASSDSTAITYQLIVSAAGNRITYTLITVTDAYQFTLDQLSALAARVPIRASQAQ